MPKHTRKRFPRRSRAQWQQLVNEYQESDLPITTFCDQNKISYPTFKKWSSRLTTGGDRPPTFVEVTPSQRPDTQKVATGWAVELSIGEQLILRIGHPQ